MVTDIPTLGTELVVEDEVAERWQRVTAEHAQMMDEIEKAISAKPNVRNR